MWLSDGSYELITGREDYLNIIEDRLGYEMRSYLEDLFDKEAEEYDDFWEKETENIAKAHREQIKMIDTFYSMAKKENNGKFI